MKNQITALIGLVACMFIVGCASTPGGPNVRQEVALWAEDSAVIALIAKPEYRPAMEAAVRSLDSAEQTGGININTITSALTQVDGLQSKDSKLAIFGGRLILRRALGNLQLETPEALNDAGLGLRDGLKAALAQ